MSLISRLLFLLLSPLPPSSEERERESVCFRPAFPFFSAPATNERQKERRVEKVRHRHTYYRFAYTYDIASKRKKALSSYFYAPLLPAIDYAPHGKRSDKIVTMFSNIASYIWGSAEEEQQQGAAGASSSSPQPPLIISNSSSTTAPPPPPPPRSDARPRHLPEQEDAPSSSSSSGGEDWVMVGGSAGRAVPGLGSLNEVVPRPATGSTGSSAQESEDGMDEEEEEEDVVLLEKPADVAAVVIPRERDQVEEEEEQEPAPVVPAPAPNRSLNGHHGGHGHGHHLAARQSALARSAQASSALRKKGPASAARPNTAKALERRNKAVKKGTSSNNSQKAAALRGNLALRSAGHGRHLKQC